jgi:hypothetical protein
MDIGIGQEVHLDLDDTVALAGLAPPALDIKREAPGGVATRLCLLGQTSKPVADRREAAGIGRWVRTRGAADRRLVDVDDLVEELDTFEPVMGCRLLARIDDFNDSPANRVDFGKGLARQID